jgi:hypothetical protein
LPLDAIARRDLPGTLAVKEANAGGNKIMFFLLSAGGKIIMDAMGAMSTQNQPQREAVMKELPRFGKAELQAVRRARAEAEALVGGFYVLAPREWKRITYEVRTLGELAPEEISYRAFAQVLCYDFTRRIGATVVERRDLYRICLQDHRILPAIRRAQAVSPRAGKPALEPFLLYLLTHELVHIVRFTQRMQRLDLAPELRPREELSVEQTTRQILAPVADHQLRQVIELCAGGC